ncbi:ATP-binding cassette subfamily B protein/ATP-binding cassette subfamily C protein [Keratinibaculum paraultunense]|uniref:ATP-binding cassette subfamily B protein/ATP-binding cassette subfamily C protein n=1 Tax=Keratinibaculum paraultunense TaxID=1278232 RepID=A0A4V2UTT3_9FIRM|nr:ABC transporter ATP-binding protein [Keratinibaculum paraultunense]QQY79543.1 ABC transporter ATP-binding protein [Keratinibaculum paraultunense]TCS87568.1 ATP-binding cassette subfamily B protein/ATP-binding cassette subfamily C protein [Keratinibaculum paraultunense]
MKQLKKMKSFLSISWKASPSYIILLLVNALLESARIVVNIILPKYLIDELLGNKDPQMLLILGSAIVLSNVIFKLIENIMKKQLTIGRIKLEEKMSQIMANKIMNVDFSYLENPYYLDLKERAVFAINNQLALENIIVGITNTIRDLITIISLLIILFSLSWVLVVFLLLTIGLNLWIYSSFANYQQEFFQSIIPINRKYGYYMGLGFQDKPQKDIRLYNMGQMLTQRVIEYNKDLMDEFQVFYNRLGKIEGLYNVINVLQASIAYGYVGLRVISDKFGPNISIGSFTMYVNAAINFSQTTTKLGENITLTFQMLQYLDPFMEFISLPETKEYSGNLKMEDEIKSISFKNVSFKYPGSDKYVLEDISFDIKGGEKISIVGLNGAGKTTLIKLLCRLYEPDSGEIFVNGHNIYDYEYESYMGKIAVIFQDYKLFAFTVGENISCNEGYKEDKKIMDLIEEVGLKEKIDSLPNGLDSLMGKAYDDKGIELSGGESQKIAIARALYKDAPLIILDEPTSALDPLAEAEIYEHFNTLVKGKTAIYISHRMSSSVFCDRILLIEDGKVVDYDSHANLMEKKDSLYYKLFTTQAKNYQLDIA